MLVIGTNMAAIRAANAASAAQKQAALSMERLSTGKRINSAKDDPAGFAIADRMTAQIRGMNQAVRNAGDGIALIQTADSNLGEVTNLLQRLRELAVQSASGTYSDDDRANMQAEATQLSDAIGDILGNTKFNGLTLFAPAPASDPVEIEVQSGANAGETVTLISSVVDLRGITGVSGGSSISVASAGDASDAIDTIDDAMKSVSTLRATLGGSASRLESVVSNLTTNIANLTNARSRIEDTDYAAETMALAKAQILSQSAMAMLAQANQMNQQLVAMLLR
jgi:flagellin